MNNEARMAGFAGNFILIAGEDTNTINARHMAQGAYYLYVMEDTVISTLEENGVDVKGEGTDDHPGKRVSGVTLPAGTPIFCNKGWIFTRVAITQGKLAIFKEV
jgi:hypothetical protein